jgi:hypothetical protein
MDYFAGGWRNKNVLDEILATLALQSAAGESLSQFRMARSPHIVRSARLFII